MPLVGAIIGAVVVSVVGLADSILAAVVCAIFYTVYQQVENYVVAPRIMRRSLNLDPMITIISALIGGTLFGVVGALVGIPMGAAAMIIYREVVVPRQDACALRHADRGGAPGRGTRPTQSPIGRVDSISQVAPASAYSWPGHPAPMVRPRPTPRVASRPGPT